MSDSDEMGNNFGNNGEIENGHVSESQISTDPETDDEFVVGGGVADYNEQQFDPDLPTAHKYLGNLENVSGDTLYDNGEIVSLLAIQTNTLVFPDFTLPLVLNSDYEIGTMQRLTERKNVFVLLSPDEQFHGLFDYGVTMEIYETTYKDHVLSLKARGRQRCQLVRARDGSSGVQDMIGQLQEVTVRILSEPVPRTPLYNTQLLALKNKRMYTSYDYRDLVKCRRYRRYHLAQFPLCSWIYDRYEIGFYVTKILNGLSKHYLSKYVPTDPVKLSYWFVQNFQLRHDERLKILKLNTAFERLRLEYRYLYMERIICCMGCSSDVAKQNDVFAMSKDGVQSNYCNPGGHVYETVTVRKAQNFDLIGNPSTLFSWFPGYAWTIMQCKQCNAHLGWRFTSHHLTPTLFYGLAKTNLDVKILADSQLVDN